MGWEKHELFILKNDGSNRTRTIKNARLYRNRFGELKNYSYKIKGENNDN